jgi:hypothetical protein
MSGKRLPTLLVGLGGTGCRIVDRVLGRARRAGMDKDQRIEFIGFDTDVVDIAKLNHLSANQVFQISDNKTVYQVATRYGRSIEDWMVPVDRLHVQVRTQSLDRGAGQLRFLTRLALHDRFSDRAFEPRVRAALAKLSRIDGRDAYKGTTNVFVVGSLAGGTASGSFLPITLLIDALLRESGANPTVNGFFLLGDIFVHTGKAPIKQLPNVRANSFAALAELHGVNSVVGPGGDIEGFGYEYLPGRRLVRDGRPFRDLTLIDFENQNGGNLGKEIEHYEKLAARALFTQIFTAIGGSKDSIVVNDLIDKTAPTAAYDVRQVLVGMGSDSGVDLTKYLSSAGVYAIEYPRDDILSYLSVRFARENLTGEWLALDRLYQARLDRFNEERRAGNFRAVEPTRDTAYIEDFLQNAREGVPFFAELWMRVEPEADVQTGRKPKPQVPSFLDALETRMVDVFWEATPDLKAIKMLRQELSPSNLGDKASITDTVQNHDARLDLDWRIATEAVRDRPDALFNNILANSLTLRPGEWRPYHIQNYVLEGNPHLVQIRYFLYAARTEIEKRLKDKKVDTDRIREELFGLATAWDPDRDPKTATERGARAKLIETARNAARGGPMAVLRGTDFKKFQQNFAGYYNDAILKIREWAEASVKRRTYSRLRNELDIMIRVVEGMFDQVRRLSERLAREEADLRDAHDPAINTVETGTLFVCADGTSKDALWDALRRVSAGRRLGQAANRSLAEAFLSAYREVRVDEKQRLPAFEQILYDTVVRDFAASLIKDDYRSSYDMTLAEGLDREARIKETEWLSFLRTLVGRTSDYARPLLPLANEEAGQPITFWAMNPKLHAAFRSTADFEGTFATEQGVRTLVEDEFPDTELLCFVMRGNLALTDIAKINPGPQGPGTAGDVREGPYHAAYRERVEALVAFDFDQPNGVFPGTMMTPHVAKDWHKPGRLVPIFDSVRRGQEERLHKAYVIAQALPGLLDRLQPAGAGNVTYLDLSRLVGRRGNRVVLVRSHDDWQIFLALAGETQFVDPILLAWREHLAGFNGPANESPVADPIVTERLLSLALNQVDGDARRKVVPGLIRAQIAAIREVIEHRHASEAFHARMQRVLDTADALGRSAVGKLQPHLPLETLRDIEAMYNSAVAAARHQIQ